MRTDKPDIHDAIDVVKSPPAAKPIRDFVLIGKDTAAIFVWT